MVSFLLRNAPLIVYGLAIIGGFYFGYKRGFFRSLWHILFHGLRIAGALFFTKILSEKALGYLFRQLQVWTVGTEFYSLFAEEQIARLIQIPIQMVLNLVLFILLMLLLAIVCKPLEIVTRNVLRLPKKKWKWLGGAVGVVSGFVILTAFVVPFGGVANLGSAVSTALTAVAAQETSPATTPTPALAYQVTEPIALAAFGDDTDMDMGNMLFAWDASFAMRFHRIAGGTAIFNYLTEVEYDGKTYSLTREVEATTKVISGVQSLSKVEMKDWSQKQVDDVKALSDAFQQSDLLPSLALSFISVANDSWEQEKPFLGIEKPNVGEVLQPSLDLMIDVVSNGTTEDLKNSMNTVTDVVQVLHDNGAFEAITSEDGAKGMLEVLGKEEVREQLMGSIQADSNLCICIPEMFSMTIRFVEKELGIDNAEDIIKDIAAAINTVKANPEANTVEIKEALLAEELWKVSNKYALELPEGAMPYVSAFLIEQFDAVPEVTDAVINDWLENYASNYLENGTLDNAQQWLSGGASQA